MQLNLVESNGQYLADSRDVAEVTGKRHSDLIRTIKGYIDTILTDAKLRSSDFSLLLHMRTAKEKSALAFTH